MVSHFDLVIDSHLAILHPGAKRYRISVSAVGFSKQPYSEGLYVYRSCAGRFVSLLAMHHVPGFASFAGDVTAVHIFSLFPLMFK